MSDHEHDWRHATGDRDTRSYDCAHPRCLATLTVPRSAPWGSIRHAAETSDPTLGAYDPDAPLVEPDPAPLPPPIRGEDDDDWGRLLTRVIEGLSVDAPRRRAQAIRIAAEAVRSAPLLRSQDNRHAELAVYAELETIRDSADYLMNRIVDYLAARGAPMGERSR